MQQSTRRNKHWVEFIKETIHFLYTPFKKNLPDNIYDIWAPFHQLLLEQHQGRRHQFLQIYYFKMLNYKNDIIL